MNKEIKYILFLIVAVVLAGLVYFLVAASNKKAIVSESPVNTSNNVIETTPVPVITTSTPIIATSAPVVIEPVYTKPIKIEFMNSADKKKIGLDNALKVQVLDRAADGTVLGYRVITESNQVLDKFGN